MFFLIITGLVAYLLSSNALANSEGGGSKPQLTTIENSGGAFRIIPITIQFLENKFGSRLVAGDFLCTLPKTAALRQPIEWDCRTWRIERVSFHYYDFESPMFDTWSVRAMPDGRVIYSSYSLEDRCDKALTAFFSIKDRTFQETDVQVAGWRARPGAYDGSMTMERTGNGSRLWSELRFENAKCTLQFVEQAL